MRIRKTVNERGSILVEIKINGRWHDIDGSPAKLSREITGTTDEDKEGIFQCGNTCTVDFAFGLYLRRFNFRRELNSGDTATDIAQVLAERIDTIRKWVAECKAKARVEEADIPTTVQLVEKSSDESRL